MNYNDANQWSVDFINNELMINEMMINSSQMKCYVIDVIIRIRMGRRTCRVR